MENCTEVTIDVHQQRADEIVQLIEQKLRQTKPNGNQNGFMSVLRNILLIGVGLFALSELFAEEPKRPRKARKKAPVRKKSRI